MDFERSMESLLPRHDTNRARSFSDLEISTVQDLLVRSGKKSWSTRPRTYAVLRLIGYLDLMQAFVVEGLTDRDFPYSLDTLPPDIASYGEASDLFLSKQYLVVGKFGSRSDRLGSRDDKKDLEVKPLNISPPIELEDQFPFHYYGPKIHISHENPRLNSKPNRTDHIKNVAISNNVSQRDVQNENLRVHKRPPPSRGSSANSQPTHKKQETEQSERLSPSTNEPLVQTRPRSSRASSTVSQPAQGNTSPEQNTRQPSPARAPSAGIQRPQAANRGLSTMSDPTQNHRSLQHRRSTSPAPQSSTPARPIGSPKSPRINSPDLRTVASNTSTRLSNPLSRTPLDNRPLSPRVDSIMSSPDQMSVHREENGDRITRYDSPDSVGITPSIKSRPSFASRTISRASTDKSPSLFSQPSSFLSTASSDSGKSRFSKMFSRNRPLIDAAKAGDADLVKEVLKMHGDSAMEGTDGKDGWNALHWAAFNGATEVCKILLARGMPTSGRTKAQYREPLFLAVKGGHLDAASALCEANCDVNANSKMDGATALHRAALEGRDDIIVLLVSYGAEVNFADVEGMRPTHWAVQAKKTTAVQTLVSCGADLEARSAAGITPLHRAVSARNVVMARLLLSLGADVNATAPSGNPLNRADATGNGDMINLLSQYGGVREQRTDAKGAPLVLTGGYAHGHLD